jgi:hypothetical protein
MKCNSLFQGLQWTVLAVFLLVAPMTTVANDDLDVTMRMVTDDVELTDSVVREIELPRAVQRPERPGEPGSRGRDVVDDVVDKARENGREFGESMSERARESREVPGGRPERPQMPERPERPELPDAAGKER